MIITLANVTIGFTTLDNRVGVGWMQSLCIVGIFISLSQGIVDNQRHRQQCECPWDKEITLGLII